MATKVAELAVDITVNGAAQTNAALGAVESKGRSVTSALQSMRGTLLAVSVGFGAVVAVAGKFVSISDEQARLAGRLKLVVMSTAEVTRQQQALFKVAQDTGAELSSVTDSFIRTANAVKTFGASQADVLKVTQTLAQTLQIQGASTAEAQSVATQLAQALGSGVVAGDELKSIVENNLTLAQALADQLTNGNVSALRKMGAEGKLLNRDVFGAMLRSGTAIQSKFDSLGGTFQQSSTRLSNAFVEAISRIDQKIGASSGLSRLLNFTASAITSVTGGTVAGAELSTTPGAPRSNFRTQAEFDAEREYIRRTRQQFLSENAAARYREALARQRNSGLDANPMALGRDVTGGIDRIASAIDAASAARRERVAQSNADIGQAVGDRTSQITPAIELIQSNLENGIAPIAERLNELASKVGGTFVDSLANGISTAVQSGSITEGIRALGATLLGGLGAMLVDFGKKALVANSLISTLLKGFASLNPVVGGIAAAGIIALGSVMVGLGQRAARSSFGGAGRSDGFSGGGFNIPTSVSSSSVFGAPSSIIADGRTPITSSGASVAAATPMVVNVFSPDDPTTQRFFRETLRRADGRGAF